MVKILQPGVSTTGKAMCVNATRALTEHIIFLNSYSLYIRINLNYYQYEEIINSIRFHHSCIL